MGKYFLTVFLIPVMFSLANAQDSLRAGTRYLAFEIDRSPYISGGYFLQDLLALEAGVGFIFNGETDTNALGIKLELDKYFNARRLTPLAGGYARFEINPDALGDRPGEGSGVTLGGHWGLHFLILPNFSVAGTVGAELLINTPKEGDNTTTFTSFTSGLKFRFLF